MKKTLVISLALLVAILLMAAIPAPQQRLTGTLRYGHSTICSLPDYISLPVMDNVYLRGERFPTHGQFQGCRINASGWYVPSSGSVGQCKVFEVLKATVVCPATASPTDSR